MIAFEWNMPMLIEVLATLNKRYGWETVCSVSFGQRERLAGYFPNAVYHDTFDARFGRPPVELADLPIAPIDQPTAEKLGYQFLLALRQMDRQEIMGGFAVHDRFIHLYRLAGYWSAVFDRLKPDLLLFPTAPHVVYDYVAYAVAKARGIRTVMFEYVTTEGMLAAIDGFEDGLSPLMTAYRDMLTNPPAGVLPLSPRMEAYLARVNSTYDVAIPAATRDIQAKAARLRAFQDDQRRAEKEASEGAARRLAVREAARVAEVQRGRSDRSFNGRAVDAQNAARANSISGRLLRRLGLQAIPHPLPTMPTLQSDAQDMESEQNGCPTGPIPPTEGHYNGRFYRTEEVPEALARTADAKRNDHLDAIVARYNELAVAPDLSVPFVYVPLHLQPERSTNPNGGVFDDQQLVARMISAALPEGWRIYIKEHRTQFAPQIAHERGRWSSFYDELLSIPGVTLVSLETPPFDLIDRACVVATVTGTSSWEAIVRGVPTFVFGEAWYKGCHGSYAVRTAQDCRDAFARIEAGERPNEASTRLLLHAAEKVSFVGYLSDEDEPSAGIDETTNVERLADAIHTVVAD